MESSSQEMDVLADPRKTWVPLTIVGAILITAISGTLYAAEISGQAKQNASDNARQDARIDANTTKNADQDRLVIEHGVMLRTIMEAVSEIKHDIKDIKAQQRGE